MGKRKIAPSDAPVNRLKQGQSFCTRLCNGDLSCLLNLLFCPAVWLYQSSRIYMLPCVGIYVREFLSWLFCGLCVKFVPCCGLYKDRKFRANASAIGKWKDKEGAAVDEMVKWERANSFYNSRLTEDQKRPAYASSSSRRASSPRTLRRARWATAG